MAQRERRTGIWMTLVTALWIAFAIGLVVLILFAAGILGPTADDGNGDQDTTAVAEQNGEAEGDGTDQDADQDTEQAEDADDAQQDEAESQENGESDAQAVFTSEQADRGQQVFSQSCAECHGGQLDGDPPLTGETFVSTWDGMPVHALYEIISQTMPQDDPGSLSNEEYEDVTAHILAFNGMQDGDSELDSQDSDAMEVNIRLGDGTEATAEEDTSDEESDEAMADEDGATEGDGEADGEAQTDSEAEAEADSETGEESTAVEAEEPAEDEEPGSDEGWIEVNVEPSRATVNILGPGGYVGQMSGSGTLTGLEPGAYVATASLGNFSHRMDAQVRTGETVTLDLYIEELAMSSDVDAGGQDGESTGDESADQEQEAAATNGEESNGQQDAAGDESADDAGGDENGNGNDQADGQSDSGDNGNDNGSGNGEEAWYTEDQASTGADEYSASCASCHNDDGTGDPPLVDGALEASFDTVWDLFNYTSSEMPQDNPGSLDEETYVVITAHLLEMNDYPAGDEELEVDEEAMGDMALDDSGNGANGDQQDGGEQQNGEEQDQQDGEQQNGQDDPGQQDDAAEADTSGARGASMYATNCAMCHGPTLEGISAPPLAGPVFLDRWGGHPVDWLYFQARTSMPPDNPGTLDDQAYTDIIVHILTENGFLEGDEQFEVEDPALENMIIGGPEQQDAGLHAHIDALRRQLHEPFEPEDPEAEEDGTQVDEVGVPQVPEESVEDQAEDQPDDAGTGNGNGENGDEAGEEGAAEGAGADNGEEEGAGQDDEDVGGEDVEDSIIDPEEVAPPVEGGEGED